MRFSVTSGGVRSRAVGFGIGAAAAPRCGRWRHAPRPRRAAGGQRVAGRRRAAPGGALAAPGGRARSSPTKTAAGTMRPGGAPRGPPTSGPAQPRARPPGMRAAHDPRPPRRGRARRARRPHDDRRVRCWSCAPTCRGGPRVLTRDLDAERFARSPWTRLAAHCAAGDDMSARRCCAEHDTLAADPALAQRFTHVFALDPPPLAEPRRSLLQRRRRRRFLHLGWGPAEVEFARAVMEHEHGLRAAPDGASTARSGRGSAGSAECLGRAAGDGRHPRTAAWPAAACGCWRSSTSRDLDRSSGTVSCTITNGGARPIWSAPQTFRACCAAG